MARILAYVVPAAGHLFPLVPGLQELQRRGHHVHVRTGEKLLASLWEQFVTALDTLARHGLAHGDLSPYNLLVHDGRLVLIDLPQVVDVIAHPTGRDYLARDARNVATWFAARGLPGADPDALALRVAEQAGLALPGRF